MSIFKKYMMAAAGSSSKYFVLTNENDGVNEGSGPEIVAYGVDNSEENIVIGYEFYDNVTRNGRKAYIESYGWDGTYNWQLDVNSTATGVDQEVYDITVDSSGNSYAFLRGDPTDKYNVIKISPSGTIVWSKSWGTSFPESTAGVTAMAGQPAWVFLRLNETRNMLYVIAANSYQGPIIGAHDMTTGNLNPANFGPSRPYILGTYPGSNHHKNYGVSEVDSNGHFAIAGHFYQYSATLDDRRFWATATFLSRDGSNWSAYKKNIPTQRTTTQNFSRIGSYDPVAGGDPYWVGVGRLNGETSPYNNSFPTNLTLVKFVMTPGASDTDAPVIYTSPTNRKIISNGYPSGMTRTTDSNGHFILQCYGGTSSIQLIKFDEDLIPQGQVVITGSGKELQMVSNESDPMIASNDDIWLGIKMWASGDGDTYMLKLPNDFSEWPSTIDLLPGQSLSVSYSAGVGTLNTDSIVFSGQSFSTYTPHNTADDQVTNMTLTFTTDEQFTKTSI